MKGLEQYDVKLLLALVKSVEGRTDFFKVLVEGPHPELAAFSNAIRGDDDAMVWLFKHDFAWLAILSNACDGDEKAIDWLAEMALQKQTRRAAAARPRGGEVLEVPGKGICLALRDALRRTLSRHDGFRRVETK